MPRYSDEYKAEAIAALTAENYPEDEYALQRVVQSLPAYESNTPSRKTVKRWFDGQQGTPPRKNVQQKKGDMADKMEELAWKFMNRASDWKAIAEMDPKSAMTAAGIAIDKMRLLKGLPTQIIGIMPQLVTALESIGENPYEVFERMIQLAHEKAEAMKRVE